MRFIVTKIFHATPDARGYQWCVDLINDKGQELPLWRCDMPQEAQDRIDRFNSKRPAPVDVEWRETGHFSLACAPEHIDGTDAVAEASRDDMMRRVDQYLKNTATE